MAKKAKKLEELLDDPDTPLVELPQGGYGHFTGDVIVDGGGMGSCISVFIYNNDKKELYAGHFDAYTLGKKLPKMLLECGRKIRNKTRSRVYIAGGGIEDGEKQEFIDSLLQDRQLVVDMVVDEGFSRKNMKIRWSTDDAISAIICYVKTGETVLQKMYPPNPQDTILLRF